MPIIFFAIIMVFPGIALAEESGVWSDLVFYIHTQQQTYHRELADAIRAIQHGGILSAGLMIMLSFFYGVFHAAGPGHGKVIIGTYLVSQESQIRKGISLSFMAASMQGLTAIILVQGLVGILGWTRAESKDLIPTLETLSFFLICGIGVLIIKRSIFAFIKNNNNSLPDHDVEHAGCGHSHVISPDVKFSDKSIKDMIVIILSVGIRPCSGSILVLIFSEVIGLRWAGILSVFAITFGVAITVSSLALLTIYFRRGALLFFKNKNGRLLQNVSLSIALLGGAFITLIGVSLILSANQTTHPLF